MSELSELKNMFTRDQVLEQSGPLSHLSAVDVELGPSISFGFDTDIGIYIQTGTDADKDRMALTPGAFKDMARYAKMPVQYAQRLPAETVVNLLNYHYHQAEFNEKRIRLLHQENRAVVVGLNPRDHFISLPDFISVVEDEVAKAELNIFGYHKPLFDPERIVLNLVLDKVVEIAPRTILNLGIRFEHSLNEYNPDRAFAYTFNQWCANGATTFDSIKNWSRLSRDPDSFRKWVPSTIKNAMLALGEEEKRLNDLATIQTNENTSTILDDVLKSNGVPKIAREEVHTTAEDQPTETLLDIWNVMTRVATHSPVFDDHPAALAVLEGAAAELAEHRELCPTCHHRLN